MKLLRSKYVKITDVKNFDHSFGQDYRRFQNVRFPIEISCFLKMLNLIMNHLFVKLFRTNESLHTTIYHKCHIKPKLVTFFIHPSRRLLQRKYQTLNGVAGNKMGNFQNCPFYIFLRKSNFIVIRLISINQHIV